MNLLDFMSGDDARLGLGLLAAAGPQATRMSAFQRIAQAFTGADELKSAQLKQKLQQAQLDDLAQKSVFESQQKPLLLDELRLKNQQHRQLGDMVSLLLGETNAGPASPSSAAAPSASPADGAAAGASPETASQTSRSSSRFDRDLRLAAALSLIDPPRGRAQMEVLKLQYPDLGEHQGVLYNKRTGEPVSSMPYGNAAGNVIQYQPLPGGGFGVTVPQGANQALADAARKKAEAEEEVKSRYKLITTPPTSPDAPPTYRSEAEALGIAPQRQPPLLVPGLGAATRPPAEQAALNAAMQADAEGRPTNVSTSRGELAPQPVIGRLPAAIPAPNAAGMSPNVSAEVKAREAASVEKYQNDAKRVFELEGKIPVLAATAQRLNRLQALTNDDKTFAAAGAEIKTLLSSIAQSFGLKVAIAKTANTEEYIAHVGELLKERLSSKDYGSGTGVSNLDLAVAGKPLPEVSRTPAGRLQIIDALRKDAERALKYSNSASQFFKENRSLSGFKFDPEVVPYGKDSPGKPASRSRQDILKQYGVSP